MALVKKRALHLVFSGLAVLFLLGGFFILSRPTTAKNVKRVSAVFDIKDDGGVIAVLPDVPAFLAKLRGGSAMRAFFDSPLGLHFLRSAPLRSAAHLHRLISLAPKSWQWSLYSLITDGPVFYRSVGNQFILVIALSNKGKAITALMSDAAAARLGDWLVVASDKKILEQQLAYMAKPAEQASALDSAFASPSALSIAIRPQSTKQRGLFRALLYQVLGITPESRCRLLLQPESDSLGLSGECTGSTAQAAAKSETVAVKDFPAYAYFQKDNKPYLLALGGFESDYGYLIPRLFFTGPASDQKILEFLSQAFKTRNHSLESRDGAIQIRYPYPYAYSERKYDLFAPYLFTNRERFFWHSYLADDKLRDVNVEIKGEYAAYLSVKLFPLLQNSEKALRQFDAIYSPGHFNEFRDALFKSTPTLQRSTLKLHATPMKGSVRIGGALTFADT